MMFIFISHPAWHQRGILHQRATQGWKTQKEPTIPAGNWKSSSTNPVLCHHWRGGNPLLWRHHLSCGRTVQAALCLQYRIRHRIEGILCISWPLCIQGWFAKSCYPSSCQRANGKHQGSFQQIAANQLTRYTVHIQKKVYPTLVASYKKVTIFVVIKGELTSIFLNLWPDRQFWSLSKKPRALNVL